jgi:hypothetical protein
LMLLHDGEEEHGGKTQKWYGKEMEAAQVEIQKDLHATIKA